MALRLVVHMQYDDVEVRGGDGWGDQVKFERMKYNVQSRLTSAERRVIPGAAAS